MALSSSDFSLLMPTQLFSTDQQLIETALISIAVCAVVLAFSETALLFAESRVQGGAKYGHLSEVLQDRALIYNGLVAREQKLAANLEALGSQIDAIETKRNQMARRLAELKRLQNQQIRSIGEPTVGLKCFQALVANGSVADYVSRDMSHPTIDDSWAHAQLVEVWSDSLTLSKAMLAERYPKAFGFSIDSIKMVG